MSYTTSAASDATAPPLPVFDIEIKDLAGGLIRLCVTAETAVGNVKRRVFEQRRNFVVHLQVLTELQTDGEFTVLADNDRTLGSYGVVSERMLCVVVQDGFCGGELVRTFGSLSSDISLFSRFSHLSTPP